jgi:hypothetical protein
VSRLWNKITGADELRFGLTRKLLVLVVLALAVLSFFLPLVSVSPPVMSQTRWSAFDIVSYVYQAGLVRSSSDLLNFPIEFALAYILALIAFYVLTLRRSQRTLVHIGVFGVGLLLYGWTRAAETFGIALFRDFPATEITSTPKVGFNDLLAALLLIMSSLLFITASEFIDGRPLPILPPIAEVPLKGEPELIYAEVVSEGKVEKTSPPRLRLGE